MSDLKILLEFIQKAQRGEDGAAEELLRMGDRFAEIGDWPNAAEANKRAAKGYKYLLHRANIFRKEDASRIKMAELHRTMLQRWIAENPSGMREVPIGDDDGLLGDIAMDDVIRALSTPFFSQVGLFLESQLRARGVVFVQGGSLVRRAPIFIDAVIYGKYKSEMDHIQDVDVRIALDLIIERIRQDRLSRAC